MLYIGYCIKTMTSLNIKFAFGTIFWIVYLFAIKDWNGLYILIPLIVYHLGGHVYFYKYHGIKPLKFMIITDAIMLIVCIICDLKSSFLRSIFFGISFICEIINFGSTIGTTYGLHEVDKSVVVNKRKDDHLKKKVD